MNARIVARTTVVGVVPCLAMEKVVSTTTFQIVSSRAPVKLVRSVTADDSIGAATAAHFIAPFHSVERVVTQAAVDQVAASAGEDIVVS